MKQSLKIEALYQDYKDKCYGFFLKTLSNPELAMDFTQDIFLNILLNQDRLHHVDNWDQYIYTICQNRAYNHLKRAGHDKKYREFLFRYWNQPENSVRPEAITRMDANHYRELLEHTLGQLPEQQRIIFQMSKMEGLSHLEIAKKLNISPYTVRNHLHRALNNIRSSIHPDLEFLAPVILFWLV